MDEKSCVDGFSTSSSLSQTRVFWNSRKRSASEAPPVTSKATEDDAEDTTIPMVMNQEEQVAADKEPPAIISERRKALFEPLEPTIGGRSSEQLLLPPPDFDTACYPKGWLIGKKRKLVNVDVVESMRRIAVQEMNRKDREINGLNEQLEEDAKILEHLQLQLLQERSKRADAERAKSLLENQIYNISVYNDKFGIESKLYGLGRAAPRKRLIFLPPQFGDFSKTKASHDGWMDDTKHFYT